MFKRNLPLLMKFRFNLIPKFKCFSSRASAILEKPALRIAPMKKATLPTDSVIPLCMFKESSLKFAKPRDFYNIIKKNLPYSRYKMNAILGVIRNKDLQDALKILAGMNKKGATLVKYQLDKHFHKLANKNNEFFELQYKIAEAFVGGRFGPGKMEMRARSKFGIRNKPYCHITIRLKKITPNKLFADAIMGNSSFVFSNFMKSLLFQNKLQFQALKDLSFMTASRSKHYRRTQLKRMILLIRKFLKGKGIVVSHNYVKERVHQYILTRKYFNFQDWEKIKGYSNLSMRMDSFSSNYKKI
jgi:ribosomal protein L22